jgi:hypothetical protein
MIMLILAGAAFTTAAMAFTGIPAALAAWVQAQNLSPYTLIAALTVMYILLGCLIDGISMIVLTVVIVLPMVKQAGFDLIWFGVYLIILVEMAQITPPVGFNLFVLQNMSGRDSFTVARAAVPFFFLLVVAVAIITIFPRSRFTCRGSPSRNRREEQRRNFPMKHLTRLTLGLAGALLLALPAAAQTKWNLPAAYPADNFHTENLAQFAKDVSQATGGKLEITVHANASLFKAPEIKRAVQTGQAQIGEVLMSLHENEDPLYGVDVVPFLATSFDQARKLWVAQKPVLEKKLAGQGLVLLYAVAWPPQGIYAKKDLNTVEDMKGLKWRAYNVGTSRIAELVGRARRDHPGRRAAAGAGDRRRELLHVVRRHGLRLEGVGVPHPLLRHPGLAAEEHDHREQGGVRRPRRGHPRCGHQGRQGGRGSRLEARSGKNQVVHGPACGQGHEGPAAVG